MRFVHFEGTKQMHVGEVSVKAVQGTKSKEERLERIERVARKHKKSMINIIQGEDIYLSIPLRNPFITANSVCVVLSES